MEGVASMGKIDIHLHLGLESKEHKREQKKDGQKVFAFGTTPQPITLNMSSSADMLPHLKKLGIRKGIILSSGEDNTRAHSNDEVRQAAEAFPELYHWMCNLDKTDVNTIEDRLRKYKEQGAVGVGEFSVNEWINSPFIEAVFTAAEKLYLPILFHMSPEAGFNYGIADHPGLPLLEDALKRHPNLIFVGHSQPFWYEISADAKEDIMARNSWGEGPVVPGGRLPYLFENYPNLYGDLSANSGGNALMRDQLFGLNFLEKYQDRLMFGTDMINTDMVFPLGAWLDDMLKEGKLSKEVYEKVCWKNAEKVWLI